MTRPLARATAMAFLALGSLSVYADDSAVSAESAAPDVSADDTAASSWMQLPDFLPSSGDFYPPSAASKLMQGSVGIEFQIDEQGRAQILSQTFTDHADFAPNAANYLTRGRFRVSPEWVQSGGPGLKFVVEVQFSLARGGGSCDKKPPHVADTEVLVVCRALPARRGGRL
jgi:hypothetical protein